MRILFNIGHPAHVHLFKNLIWNLEKKGHECKITTIDKEIAVYLLDVYGFNYDIIGSAKSTLISKAVELMKIDYRLYEIAKYFKPDILIGGVGNVYVTHVGKLIGKPSIVFDDTEHAKIEHFLLDPFASSIVTPQCFKKDLGEKQIRYNGYHEMAYLHPNYFHADISILEYLGINKNEKFSILRFVGWNASHDFGHKGIDLTNKLRIARVLEQYGRVLISSEMNLPAEFDKYIFKVAPERMHDLLQYATLLFGESATMASECAVLGTSAIYLDFAGRGYTDEEETRYGLVYNFKTDKISQENALSKALELIKKDDIKKESALKSKKLIQEKIDVTAFMTWFIENYPESFKKMKNENINNGNK